MLFETIKDDIRQSKEIKKRTGSDSMSMVLVRPFDIQYKGERHPVVMVRIDNAGTRLYAIPSAEEQTEGTREPLRWIAERWVEKVLPYEIQR